MARERGLYPGVSRRIEEIRLFKGWTWDEFAAATQVKRSTLYGLKTGDPTPDVDTAFRICSAIDRTVEWLLTGKNPAVYVDSAVAQQRHEQIMEGAPPGRDAEEEQLLAAWRTIPATHRQACLDMLEAFAEKFARIENEGRRSDLRGQSNG